jgi:hypothetical protein
MVASHCSELAKKATNNQPKFLFATHAYKGNKNIKQTQSAYAYLLLSVLTWPAFFFAASQPMLLC